MTLPMLFANVRENEKARRQFMLESLLESNHPGSVEPETSAFVASRPCTVLPQRPVHDFRSDPREFLSFLAQHQAIGVFSPCISRGVPPEAFTVSTTVSIARARPCQLLPAISGSNPNCLATKRLTMGK